MAEKGTQSEYIARINKAIDYIEQNIDHQFTLADLAESAHFSKFHFHRIFHAIVGETPFQFIARLRLERSASLLMTQPDTSLTDIAFMCGYSDLSIFSRNFKKRFGMSASEFRKQSLQHSNMSQTPGKHHQAALPLSSDIYFDFQTLKWKTNMKLNESVEVRQLPDMTVAYVRHIGPYKGDGKLFEGLWHKLFNWAGPRGLVGGPGFNSLIVYHDDPNITSEGQLRTSVCITVPDSTDVAGEVGKMPVDGGKYVVARFKLGEKDFEEAWKWVYGEWFPQSGYQPDDKPCLEFYPEPPSNGSFTVDICVPVKPL